MAYVNGKTWRQLHLRRMKYLYGRLVEAWEGKYTDDRGALCLTYRAMEAALRSLPAEPGKYVQAAMNDRMREDRIKLDKIVKKYGEVALRA